MSSIASGAYSLGKSAADALRSYLSCSSLLGVTLYRIRIGLIFELIMNKVNEITKLNQMELENDVHLSRRGTRRTRIVLGSISVGYHPI